MFRPLNDIEQNAILSSDIKGKTRTFINAVRAQVAYFREGNRTTAVVLDGTNVFAGSAKRNPGEDRRNDLTGQMFAFTRAVQSEPVALPFAFVGSIQTQDLASVVISTNNLFAAGGGVQ